MGAGLVGATLPCAVGEGCPDKLQPDWSELCLPPYSHLFCPAHISNPLPGVLLYPSPSGGDGLLAVCQYILCCDALLDFTKQRFPQLDIAATVFLQSLE